MYIRVSTSVEKEVKVVKFKMLESESDNQVQY